MPENAELKQRLQRIGGLVQEIESIADPSVRASTKELVQLLMEFHGAGLDRALEIAVGEGDLGLRIIDKLGRDPLVGSLLVLYGLHPEDLETRVRRAVEGVRPKVQRGGGELELVGLEDGVVRLRLTLTGHSCGSTGSALQATVEDAIYQVAPDIASIVVEGLEGKPAGGFVSLDNLLAGMAGESLAVGTNSSSGQSGVRTPTAG